jgi:3,4-dihydroxyphthalate decarboxylase
LVGANNIPAARLAAGGLPVFPRPVLINTEPLAAEMRAAMGARPVCVLRGHGITTTGTTLEQAVARALAVDSLARMATRVVAAGGTPTPIAAADLAQLPDLGTGFNDIMLWRHHERRLAEAGLALP